MNTPLRKRLLDLGVTFVTVPIWVPVFLLCVLAQAVFEGRPVFYASWRRVQGQRQARTWKFRTMVRNAASFYNRDTVPVDGHRFLNTPIDSPLYTRTGRWIERCQFTELPQVFQVLAGTLSIIGNRPLPENVIAALREAFPHTEGRFDSPCGLTGIVQLVGRESLTDADRLALEVRYCRTVNTRYVMHLDILIFLYTVLIHSRLKKAYTVDDAHRFLNRFAPAATEQQQDAPAAGGADDFAPLRERQLP